MNRYLVIVAIVGVGLWFFNRSCNKVKTITPTAAAPSGQVETTTGAGGVSGPSRARRISVRPDFDSVCARHNVIIVSWKEPKPDVVDIVVKSRSFNEVNDILDDLLDMGILKDVPNYDDKNAYAPVAENGEFWFYRHHVLRAYKDKP